MSWCNTKNIITLGTFGFSIMASMTVLGIASYKIISQTGNSDLWTGMLTFLVGLYIPSPMTSFVKLTNSGNAVVQQNIQSQNDSEEV
jgi:hypothetical protein